MGSSLLLGGLAAHWGLETDSGALIQPAGITLIRPERGVGVRREILRRFSTKIQTRIPSLITATPFVLMAGGNAAQNHPFSYYSYEFPSSSFFILNDPGGNLALAFQKGIIERTPITMGAPPACLLTMQLCATNSKKITDRLITRHGLQN